MRISKFAKMILSTALVFLAAFLLLRFIPAQYFCTRALECAALKRFPTAPFQPQFDMSTSSICGDLAKMSNRKDLCQYRSEKFTTDAWGYRNNPEVLEQTNDILLFGDSFAFGEGNSQEFIPSMQLSSTLHAHVYNGAGKIELEYLSWLLDHLNSPPKAILFFHLERHSHKKSEIDGFSKKISSGFFDKLKVTLDYFKQFNPLEIALNRFEKEWVVQKLFPNRFENTAKIETLSNQVPMLFLPSSIDRYFDPRTNNLSHDADYFEALKTLLDKKAITLHVVLVPEKYSVYAPYLAQPAQITHTHYLDLLDKELKTRKVHSINLLPKMQEVAGLKLKKNKYLYWTDDTHWNPDGIKLATEIIKDSLSDF